MNILFNSRNGISSAYIAAWDQQVEIIKQDFTSCKMHLENMFSDTDSNIEKVSIMTEILSIEQSMLNPIFGPWRLSNIDDYGRHTEMALKMEPTNSYFNAWNGNDSGRTLVMVSDRSKFEPVT